MNLTQYQQFVEKVTSQESNDFKSFLNRINNLENQKDAIIPLLMTSAVGLSSETGEFNEIVKKIIFQGKPLTADNIFHMKRELGDILWYWVNACRSLGLDPNDVLAENIKKLSLRYPDLQFDVLKSEVRDPNDL
jgi:NTP pyrophosphatase (non-canonical NTP hydrolase)